MPQALTTSKNKSSFQSGILVLRDVPGGVGVAGVAGRWSGPRGHLRAVEKKYDKRLTGPFYTALGVPVPGAKK